MTARMCIAIAVLGLLCAGARGEPVVLNNQHWRATIDPATLQTDLTTKDGRTIAVSSAGESVAPGDVQSSDAELRFRRGAVLVSFKVTGDALSVDFATEQPGKITWPMVPLGQAKALILPTYEGAYVPVNDGDWREFLSKQSPLDTTAGLTLPFWGLDLDGATLTYILTNPFNNELSFSEEAVAPLTHEFTPNHKRGTFGVVVRLTDASPIAPAKAFRKHLIDRGEFVSMREKIKRTPKAARLAGAAHVYVWGDAMLSRYDVREWKNFAGQLETKPDVLAKFSDEAKKLVHEIATNDWPGDYAKDAVARELCAQYPSAEALVAAFGDALADPATWGDGVSLKLLDQLKGAGLDRVCITTGDFDSALYRPQVARRADEIGYLFGPYDSYHSIHAPTETETWTTAQFDEALYDTGPIVRRDGSKRAGFKKKGFTLSPQAARPYVEKRVNGRAKMVPFSSWFIDCDAFGEVFDDYSPLHPMTQAQDAAERRDRMQWIASSQGAAIGSEGGSLYAVPAIHFAHGVMTPVIGWGDPDLTSPKSKYFLGKYWPADGPAVFVKQVPLKPYYAKLFYDPRFRLPLYQTVFHDSVAATHHWTSASLKFVDQVQTMALLESLYNIPPLYHLNLAEWKKHRERIVAHYAFFSPLHRELSQEAMTEFSFLTDDRLVQRTRFNEKVELIANFRDAPADVDGQAIPARSNLAKRRDGRPDVVYSPRP